MSNPHEVGGSAPTAVGWTPARSARHGTSTQQPAGSHPEYGDLVRLTGLTSSGRAITLVAQVDRLPLALVDIEAE